MLVREHLPGLQGYCSCVVGQSMLKFKTAGTWENGKSPRLPRTNLVSCSVERAMASVVSSTGRKQLGFG